MLTKFYYPVINVRNSLDIHLERYKLKALVCGISGGLDSATTAALARPVCDKYGIPLIGRSLTIESNKEEEIERAREVGQIFCTRFEENDLTQLYFAKLKVYEALYGPLDKIAKGNLKARTRMEFLYSIAGMENGMVLSTDNYTEFLLGFWTLHGDVGDFGMLQYCWKTEVYRMAEYLASVIGNQPKDFPYALNVDKKGADALIECVKGVPTGGLGISNSDLDQIMPGWEKKYRTPREAYEAVDIILINYTQSGNAYTGSAPVLERYERAKVKRANPFNVPRTVVISGMGDPFQV